MRKRVWGWEKKKCNPGSRFDSPDLHSVMSGGVIVTPFSSPETFSFAPRLFLPVSFLRLFSWFHLPSNNVVGNTIHVYR